jgi:hypothetical protein
MHIISKKKYTTRILSLATSYYSEILEDSKFHVIKELVLEMRDWIRLIGTKVSKMLEANVLLTTRMPVLITLFACLSSVSST